MSGCAFANMVGSVAHCSSAEAKAHFSPKVDDFMPSAGICRRCPFNTAQEQWPTTQRVDVVVTMPCVDCGNEAVNAAQAKASPAGIQTVLVGG
jgi:hypothetical protein